MNTENVLKMVVLAGEIMLSNGAETYRVEDTMKRILIKCNFTLSESFVTPTGITATIEDDNKKIITMVRRIGSRTNNLEKVTLVNQFSRDICSEKLPIDESYERLLEIQNKPPFNTKLKIFASGLACFSFTFMFGGTFIDGFASFIISLLVFTLFLKLSTHKVSNMMINLICGGVIALLGILLVNIGVGFNYDKIITASIMPYVPGLLLTNAVRDMIEGDFLSGTTRISDATVVSITLALGVGTVLKIWLMFFGSIIL